MKQGNTTISSAPHVSDKFKKERNINFNWLHFNFSQAGGDAPVAPATGRFLTITVNLSPEGLNRAYGRQV
ncbi:MAG: hypothetical protein IT250_04025 [Chitinophagaceae bacterium]|nr:hypothetical protein [Chitinophagaceae bacterium]